MNTVYDSNYDRVPNDHYPTPEWVTRALLKYLPKKKGAVFLEPAAGNNAMARVLAEVGPVYVSDIQGVKVNGWNIIALIPNGAPKDFLAIKELPKRVTHIVTNPPYKDKLPYKFIKHAQFLMNGSGVLALLMRHNYDAGATRNDVFTHYSFDRKITLTTRPKFIDDGSPASGKHDYAWYVWDFDRDPNTCRPAKMLYVNRRDVDPDYPKKRTKK